MSTIRTNSQFRTSKTHTYTLITDTHKSTSNPNKITDPNNCNRNSNSNSDKSSHYIPSPTKTPKLKKTLKPQKSIRPIKTPKTNNKTDSIAITNKNTTNQNYLILGLDPGTYIGYSLVSIFGDILLVKSKKGISINDVIKETKPYGTILIVSTDKQKIPKTVESIKAKLNAKIIPLKKEPLVSEKINLINKLKYKYNLDIKDDHQRDSLFAAYISFQKIKPLIDKINKKVRKNLRNQVFKECFINNKSINTILSEISHLQTSSLLQSKKQKRVRKTKPKPNKNLLFYKDMISKRGIDDDSNSNPNISISKSTQLTNLFSLVRRYIDKKTSDKDKIIYLEKLINKSFLEKVNQLNKTINNYKQKLENIKRAIITDNYYLAFIYKNLIEFTNSNLTNIISFLDNKTNSNINTKPETNKPNKPNKNSKNKSRIINPNNKNTTFLIILDLNKNNENSFKKLNTLYKKQEESRKQLILLYDKTSKKNLEKIKLKNLNLNKIKPKINLNNLTNLTDSFDSTNPTNSISSINSVNSINRNSFLTNHLFMLSRVSSETILSYLDNESTTINKLENIVSEYRKERIKEIKLNKNRIQ